MLKSIPAQVKVMAKSNIVHLHKRHPQYQLTQWEYLSMAAKGANFVVASLNETYRYPTYRIGKYGKVIYIITHWTK